MCVLGKLILYMISSPRPNVTRRNVARSDVDPFFISSYPSPFLAEYIVLVFTFCTFVAWMIFGHEAADRQATDNSRFADTVRTNDQHLEERGRVSTSDAPSLSCTSIFTPRIRCCTPVMHVVRGDNRVKLATPSTGASPSEGLTPTDILRARQFSSPPCIYYIYYTSILHTRLYVFPAWTHVNQQLDMSTSRGDWYTGDTKQSGNRTGSEHCTVAFHSLVCHGRRTSPAVSLSFKNATCSASMQGKHAIAFRNAHNPICQGNQSP